MWRYYLNILQLLLSPVNGWKDLAADDADPECLRRAPLLSLLTLTALSEAIRAYYVATMSLATILERIVLCFGAFYVSFLVVRLILEMYVPRLVDGPASPRAIQTVAVYAVSLIALTQLVINCFPPGLYILKFLPIYIVLVVYESWRYMQVRAEADMYYALLSLVAVMMPVLFYIALMLVV